MELAWNFGAESVGERPFALRQMRDKERYFLIAQFHIRPQTDSRFSAASQFHRFAARRLHVSRTPDTRSRSLTLSEASTSTDLHS